MPLLKDDYTKTEKIDGTYKLVGSHILVDDEEDENYNADLLLTLRSMPAVSISLQSIFENVEQYNFQ